MENRLELDTSVLKEKKQIGESVTDLNDIHLFTDEFNLILYKKKIGENVANQRLQEQCFVFKDTVDEINILKNRMFYSEKRIVNKETQKEMHYGNYYMLLGSIFIGIVVCCIIYLIVDNRGGVSDDVDIDN